MPKDQKRRCQIKWYPAPKASQLQNVLSTDWKQNAVIVKQNPKRTVFRIQADDQLPLDLYVKHDHPVTFWDSIKSLWRCKAKQEFYSERALEAANVPVVPMLAWGRQGKDSYLVSEGLKGSQPFHETWAECSRDPAFRRHFLSGLAQFLRKLFESGVWHPDMHSGNVLAVRKDDHILFYLVDIYKVKTDRQLTETQKIIILCWLAGFLDQLHKAELNAFLDLAVPVLGKNPGELVRRIRVHQAKMARHKWRGRRRRLLQQSSLCELQKTESGQWLLMRPFQLDVAEAAFAAHEEKARDPHALLKHDIKRQVSRVMVSGNSYIIKEFRCPGPWGTWRPDCRSWLNTCRMSRHHIPVAKCFAWLRTRDKRGLLILEDVGEKELYHLLSGYNSPKERRPLLQSAARLAARLHQARITHGDLKLANFMVTTSPDFPNMPLTLVDSDSMDFGRYITLKNRNKNLLQILNSFPPNITPGERSYFLEFYANEEGLPRKKQARLVSRLAVDWNQ